MNTNVMSQTLITEIAPKGSLRVGINLGNPLLAGLDQNKNPIGISVDLANELAKQLKVTPSFTTFQKAGDTVDAIKNNTVDLVFVAIDPVRGADIDYSPAYVQIEGAYLVKSKSPITDNKQVDEKDIRVVVGKGSAYDLFLTRELKNANIIRAANSQAVVDQFITENLEVAAGVKQQLEADAKRYPDLRMLPGRFMVINQAMGVPKGRPIAVQFISKFIAEMKSSGFIQDAITRHHVEGIKVAE
jgi:polar amino acid transport system substrate-binding protein